MKTAWEHVVKAASNLHRQGQVNLTCQQLKEEALRLGWSGAPSTLTTHITAHMRADRDAATRPYLDYLSHNTYRLNDAGRRAAEGL